MVFITNTHWQDCTPRVQSLGNKEKQSEFTVGLIADGGQPIEGGACAKGQSELQSKAPSDMRLGQAMRARNLRAHYAAQPYPMRPQQTKRPVPKIGVGALLMA